MDDGCLFAEGSEMLDRRSIGLLLLMFAVAAWAAFDFRAEYTHGKRLRTVEEGRFYRSGQLTEDGFREIPNQGRCEGRAAHVQTMDGTVGQFQHRGSRQVSAHAVRRQPTAGGRERDSSLPGGTGDTFENLDDRGCHLGVT